MYKLIRKNSVFRKRLGVGVLRNAKPRRFYYVIGNCVDSSLSPRSAAKRTRKQFPRLITENKYARSAFCSFNLKDEEDLLWEYINI